ncbi:MAG: acyl carrier protein [Deltaproteobacteria bacterium]|nr:acyl carrier protein [Deltaproteobacteria bacterium]
MSDTLTKLIGIIESLTEEEGLIPVTEESAFGNDLELESIELVTLFERVQKEYGDRVDFVKWLSGKDFSELNSLTVGDVVEYIDQCLTS